MLKEGKMLNNTKCFFNKIINFLFEDKEIPFKKKLTSSILVNLGLVFSVFIFIPFEMFIGNTSEFSFDFTSFAVSILLIGLLIFIALTIFELFFKGKLFKLVLSAVFGVTLASYVQSMFLNGMMKSLDGSSEGWTTSQKVLNLAIWVIVFISPVIISLFWKKISMNVNKYLSLAIVTIQLVGLLSIIFTIPSPNLQKFPTTEGLYNVSGKKNVIVFVLDRFDNKNIDNILAKDPKFLDKFKGFTYYPNTVGSYIYTQNTLPYLITGVKNPDLYITAEEKAHNIENSEFLNTIKTHTGGLSVFSEPKFLETSANNITDLIDNVKETELILSTKKVFKPAIKSSLYRVAPFVFKSRFSYTSNDFNAATYSKQNYTVYKCEDHKYDAEFLDNLNSQGLVVDKELGDTAFKIIHFQGGHFPYHLTEDGKYSVDETDPTSAAKGSLNVVYKYLEELKRLNVYKDASIFITSDHGETILIKDLTTFTTPNVNPIMFYKPSGVDNSINFTTSNAPVSHENIFPTVIKEIGGDYASFGTPITDIKEDEILTREFYWSVWDPTKEGEYYLPHKFVIEGDSRDAKSWKYVGP